MARQRQIPRDLRSLWKRAGERAGDGAGALFASLDAQDALDAQEALAEQAARAAPLAAPAPPPFSLHSHPISEPSSARAQAATALERLAARIRAGAWSDEIAALAAQADRLTRTTPGS